MSKMEIFFKSLSNQTEKFKEKNRREIFHLHSVRKDFHIQTESQCSHEDPHWRETVLM